MYIYIYIKNKNNNYTRYSNITHARRNLKNFSVVFISTFMYSMKCWTIFMWPIVYYYYYLYLHILNWIIMLGCGRIYIYIYLHFRFFAYQYDRQQIVQQQKQTWTPFWVFVVAHRSHCRDDDVLYIYILFYII